MFFDFTEREKDGAGDIKSRAVGARTLLVERRKEEPMGMSGPLSRTVKLKTDRYIFLFLRVLKFLLCPQPTKNLASHPFTDNRLHHTIYRKAASFIVNSQNFSFAQRKGKDSLVRTEKERSSKMADFGFLLPDRLKSRFDLNQQHQRKPESFEHRLEKAKLKRQV